MPRPLLISIQSDYLIRVFDTKFTNLMTNSADPDQLASSEATDLDIHCLLRQGMTCLARGGLKGVVLSDKSTRITV